MAKHVVNNVMLQFFPSKFSVQLLLLAPVILVPVLFFDTTMAMIHVWTVNETFTHGFLIFPLSIWMIWQKRHLLARLPVEPQPVILLLLLPALLLWVIANIVDVLVVQQFAMIMVIVFSIWLITGWQTFSKILFPLCFLFFAVPFGQIFIPPLMEFTADFTVTLIKFSGIPVYREGMFFTLPTGTWSVVEECSGVRYLIASTTLGCVYAYLNYSSTRKRFIFILLSILLPIIGNGLRAYGIVMIGHFSGMELAIGADHLVYGWVFFGFIIFLLFYAGSFWRDEDSIAVAEMSQQPAIVDTRKKQHLVPVMLITSLVLVLLSSASVRFLHELKLQPVQSAQLILPDTIMNWNRVNAPSQSWHPYFDSPDQALFGVYQKGRDRVQVDVGYYHMQRQGAEAVSSGNRISSPLGGEWKKVNSQLVVHSEMSIKETEIRNTDTSLLVWHWYKIGAFYTVNPYIAKMLDAYNFIILGRTDAAMIVVSTPRDQNIERSRNRLMRFTREVSESIENLLEKNSQQIIQG